MTIAAVCEFLRSNSQFKDLRIDSRQIQAGDIFVACVGRTTDGRNYIPQAIENGAAALVVEQGGWEQFSALVPRDLPTLLVPDLQQNLPTLAATYYQHPSQQLKVIGITGTNGKTSTSNYIAQFLTAHGHTCGVMGTLGNGLLNRIEPSALTTSDCCTIQQNMAAIYAAGAEFVAMEVSSIGLDQERLQQTQINTGIFTNFTQDHLDYHQTLEAYFAAKCRLFTDFNLRYAIVNLDDSFSTKILEIIPTTTKVITYSLHNTQADVYMTANIINTPWGSGELHTRLVGKFNRSNVLAAIACCALHGVSLSDLLAYAPQLCAVTGRMEPMHIGLANVPAVIVDYAHTPDALSKALAAIQETNTGKLFCIFGCGGDRDRRKRPLMTRAVLEFSDEIVITNDNPRTEDPQQIVQDMLAGITTQDKISIELDRAKAIQQTLARAGKDDVILIAGKGHENYQIIGTNVYDFSDQTVARAALLTYSVEKL